MAQQSLHGLTTYFELADRDGGGSLVRNLPAVLDRATSGEGPPVVPELAIADAGFDLDFFEDGLTFASGRLIEAMDLPADVIGVGQVDDSACGATVRRMGYRTLELRVRADPIGRAIVGTGSPFAMNAQHSDGAAAQVNNAYIFPGVGLGALASGASFITDGMFMAAARALADRSRCAASLLPPIEDLRDVAAFVASAVASQAVLDGVATFVSTDWKATIAGRMWSPAYEHTRLPELHQPPRR